MGDRYVGIFKDCCAALEEQGVVITTREASTDVEYRLDGHLVATGWHLGRTDFWTSLDTRLKGLISAHHTLYHHLST